MKTFKQFLEQATAPLAQKALNVATSPYRTGASGAMGYRSGYKKSTRGELTSAAASTGGAVKDTASTAINLARSKIGQATETGQKIAAHMATPAGKILANRLTYATPVLSPIAGATDVANRISKPNLTTTDKAQAFISGVAGAAPAVGAAFGPPGIAVGSTVGLAASGLNIGIDAYKARQAEREMKNRGVTHLGSEGLRKQGVEGSSTAAAGGAARYGGKGAPNFSTDKPGWSGDSNVGTSHLGSSGRQNLTRTTAARGGAPAGSPNFSSYQNKPLFEEAVKKKLKRKVKALRATWRYYKSLDGPSELAQYVGIPVAADMLYSGHPTIASAAAAAMGLGLHGHVFSKKYREYNKRLKKKKLMEETITEARVKVVKLRIRGGKVQRRKKVSNVPGMTLRSGRLVRMSPTERRNRRMGQRKGKIKRKAKIQRAIMKRKRSLLKRKRLGF